MQARLKHRRTEWQTKFVNIDSFYIKKNKLISSKSFTKVWLKQHFYLGKLMSKWLGRGRKELHAYLTCVRKTLVSTESNQSLQKLFSFAWCKPLLSQQYHFKSLTNECAFNGIVDKTFKEIDSFSKLIIIFEIFKQEK